MASRKVHCEDCVRELGEPFDYVHAWLDGTACVNGKLNVYHRRARHHKEGVEEVRKKWGDRAAEAAIIHIKRDEGTVPTRAQMNKRYPKTPLLMEFSELRKQK